jgi:hypothetical protein
MADFSPRQGSSDYIRPRGKQFYYRRVIPPKFRSFFGGKTEWNIKLESATAAGRRAEAGALAHKHNRMMVADLEAIARTTSNSADFGLAISADKTDTADFRGGLLISPTPIQYLGFTFDGQKTLIRASSLDAYRGKMRRGIHAKMIAAKSKKILPTEVFKRECLSRYTHLGKRRNFLRYAYKAANVMGCPEIKRQVSHHMTWFNRAWEREIVKVFGSVAMAI